MWRMLRYMSKDSAATDQTMVKRNILVYVVQSKQLSTNGEAVFDLQV